MSAVVDQFEIDTRIATWPCQVVGRRNLVDAETGAHGKGHCGASTRARGRADEVSSCLTSQCSHERGDEVYPRTFSTRDTPETVAASVILSDIALAKAENRSEQTKADENDRGPQIAGPKHVKRKRQCF